MAVLHSLSQCAVCYRLLHGEAADVDGELWCHPCADKRAEPSGDDLHDQLGDVRQALFERTRLMDAMQDARDEYRDLLKDILDCEAEERAIGGGPDFKQRRAKAYAAAWERFSG